MKLFELYESNEPTTADIVALINQLSADIERGEVDPNNYTVDELLDYFQKYDIILDTDDLYNMVQQPPLKDLITNIQGDQVIFKDHPQDNSVEIQDGDREKTVQKMAKKAMKR